MSERKVKRNRLNQKTGWRVGALVPLIALSVVGCGPPILTGMHPDSVKTTVWVGVRGSIPGWDAKSIQEAITQDGAVPLIQSFPAGASVAVLDKALGTYHASLYIWVQEQSADAQLAQVALGHPNEKLEVIAPASLGLNNEVRVRTPDANQVGYALGYAAGLLATDIGQNQVGILADAKNSVSQTEIEAMLGGLYSAGNVLTALPATLSPNSATTSSVPPTGGTANTAQTSNGTSTANATGPSGVQGNVPGISGFIPQPVTRVVLALRPLTAAEWKLCAMNGIFVLSLVGDSGNTGLVGEPVAPPFSAVESDVEALVAGKWAAGSVSAVAGSPVWFQPAAFTAATMTAIQNLQQTMPTSSQILQRWNGLPSTLRSQWAVWVNTGS